MAMVSMTKGYKTTAEKRASAQRTRAARAEARKPQAVVVDEALSAALRRLRVKLDLGELGGKQTIREIADGIVEGAVLHLVNRRGFANEPSREALRERLSRPRSYRTNKLAEA